MALADVRAVTDQIQAMEAQLNDISAQRDLLDKYRSERTRFANLITDVQASLDTAMTAYQAQLVVLRNLLITAYPLP